MVKEQIRKKRRIMLFLVRNLFFIVASLVLIIRKKFHFTNKELKIS